MKRNQVTNTIIIMSYSSCLKDKQIDYYSSEGKTKRYVEFLGIN